MLTTSWKISQTTKN